MTLIRHFRPCLPFCFCSRPDYRRWGICMFLLADHLSTCSFFSMYRVIGVGDVYFRCTCTHIWCWVSTSSSGDVNVLWMCVHPQSRELDCFLTHFRARALARVLFSDAHVSLVMSLVLFLHTCLMLRKNIVFRRCQRSLNVCTPAVYGIRLFFWHIFVLAHLHVWCFPMRMFLWWCRSSFSCTHVWCYVSTSFSGDVNILWMYAHSQT